MVIKVSGNQVSQLEQNDDLFVEWYVETVMRSFFSNYYLALTPDGLREMVLNGRRIAERYGLI